MSNSPISDNLSKLLKIHHELSLSELARQTNIPQPTLHHLLNGTTKRPRRKVLESLANYFNISIAQLIGQASLYDSIPEEVKQSFSITTIPVISWDMIENWPNNRQEVGQFGEIIFTKELGKNSFALIVQNGNVSLFPDNSILIFDSQKELKDREFVIVYSPKNGKVLVNRLFIEKSDYFIKQEQPNGDMKLIKLNLDSDRVLGSLIEARLVQFQ
ncbi:HTH-type transcriptional regulator [Legionella beliardensis]|uniref:HTH-type transcriptional regulator n=1 Tax=Legionella beliardensis TaxID=91822 RepID=A0A378IBK8_9GAMM|nr:helix-turn-helix domain-containing protein [Legionella beliardensis]STX29684.1 HTH-type transcriptional regulator [Legionella beliardensis]